MEKQLKADQEIFRLMLWISISRTFFFLEKFHSSKMCLLFSHLVSSTILIIGYDLSQRVCFYALIFNYKLNALVTFFSVSSSIISLRVTFIVISSHLSFTSEKYISIESFVKWLSFNHFSLFSRINDLFCMNSTKVKQQQKNEYTTKKNIKKTNYIEYASFCIALRIHLSAIQLISFDWFIYGSIEATSSNGWYTRWMSDNTYTHFICIIRKSSIIHFAARKRKKKWRRKIKQKS